MKRKNQRTRCLIVVGRWAHSRYGVNPSGPERSVPGPQPDRRRCVLVIRTRPSRSDPAADLGRVPAHPSAASGPLPEFRRRLFDGCGRRAGYGETGGGLEVDFHTGSGLRVQIRSRCNAMVVAAMMPWPHIVLHPSWCMNEDAGVRVLGHGRTRARVRRLAGRRARGIGRRRHGDRGRPVRAVLRPGGAGRGGSRARRGTDRRSQSSSRSAWPSKTSSPRIWCSDARPRPMLARS